MSSHVVVWLLVPNECGLLGAYQANLQGLGLWYGITQETLISDAHADSDSDSVASSSHY